MSGQANRGPRTSHRYRSGTVNLCFLLSALASGGLIAVYAGGGQPQLEGALLFVALGSVAVGLVLWAQRFLPQGPYVQEREPLTSTPTERRAFTESFERGAEPIGRRSFMAKMLGLALGALGVAALFPIRSLGPNPGRSLFVTKWRRGSLVVDPNGVPVKAADVDPGTLITVFPQGHVGSADSQTVLVRVDPALLRPAPDRRDWAPDGILGFSKVCTHAGCPVGLYEEETNRLFCPCHQSVFDVLDACKPVAGPATRPLPQLPLEVDAAGFLRSRDDFDEPIGPWFWNAGD